MKLSRDWIADELAKLHPRVKAALDALDTWVQSQGLEELLVVEALSERDDWARAGCSWCVRLRVYSRPQRQLIRKHLAAGKVRPDWEIFESGDTLRCLFRDFPWRQERLGQKG
jgi:hypothetical protein